ncbi:39S ribosomal protein L47, mitochondrial [Geranomyces variabilis]|uniref:Large ribosomal subunit protein uL29m n=1 Tax=Geranomyces variabilis TaxID=109894 RepID=A0AAD5TFN8_9FUNG|nr:39S ribosomal protein L47, mitochondrial [Geranomyces variabilis]
MATRPFTALRRCFSASTCAFARSPLPSISAISAAPATSRLSSTQATASPTTAATAAAPTSPAAQQNNLGLRRGLEDFFEESLGRWSWNEEEVPTGRAWLAAELRTKSFEDLHCLWWTCIKEQNRLYSQKEESRRFNIFFPHRQRLNECKLTMKRIKLVLWERRIAWFRAQAVLKREERRAALVASGLSPAEVDAKMAELFPVPIADIGRKPSKVRTERDSEAKREATLGRKKRGGKNEKSSWFIV